MSATKVKLSQEELKRILEYNPETGKFTWLVYRKGTRGIGKEAGNLHPTGYVYIWIDYIKYTATRLAFLYMGEPIPKYVDHLNGNKDDNRWVNLRPATMTENNRNRALGKMAGPFPKGVTKRKDRFEAHITVDSKYMYLGRYDTVEEASAVAIEARDKYHKNFSNHN